jgi:hypothetical protein
VAAPGRQSRSYARSAKRFPACCCRGCCSVKPWPKTASSKRREEC